MKPIKLVIDIGSKYTTISQVGKGLVIKEPSIALMQAKRSKMKLIACGKAALAYIGHTNENEQALYPIKDGVVFHENAAVMMFKAFMDKLCPKYFLIRPSFHVIACVSCGLTNTEKSNIERVLLLAGACEVIIVEAPLAINMHIDDMIGARMIVDLGANNTQIAIVGKDGIISGCTVNVGGDTFNQAIMDYITDTRHCRISNSLAEKVKRQIGSLYSNDASCITVEMTEIASGQKCIQKIFARDIKNAIEPYVIKIVEVIYNLSFQIPESLAEEIYINGIALSGGSSSLAGLADYISAVMSMKVFQINDASNASVLGGLYFFEHRNKLSNLLNLPNLK